MYIDLEEAARLLAQSQPVAIPTETVWGLAARMEDERGVEAIFRLKNRPPQNPLIIHIHDPCVIKEYAQELSEEALLLMNHFWPGGLTLALPIQTEKIPSSVRAGLSSAAFRMPDNPTTLDLIKITGPLVAPSANLSGKPSATTREHVERDFGKDFPLLYSPIQPCNSGIESTILVWKGGFWRLGRPGAISVSAIEKILGYAPSHLMPAGKTPLCPGQLYRHYAPKAQLHLEKNGWSKDLAHSFDGVLGFSDRSYEGANIIVAMGSSCDICSVSHRLYAALRELDEQSLSHVFVDMNLSSSPEWLPIRDRLLKASAC